ncbi:MAG: EamA family transporter [Deltaproteobacteria bacterium]|nr:EamA family transporter [Deltaproteobacteria bacterium]
MSIALLLLLNLLYAATPTCTAVAADTLPPLTFVWMRHTLAALVILPFVWRRGFQPMPWAVWGRIALATALAFTIASLLQAESLRRSAASVGALIVAMEPITMIVFAACFLREGIRPLQAMALGMAVLGFLTLSGGGNSALLAGNCLYLIAVICEATLAVLLKPVVARYAPTQVLAACLGCAALYLLPFQSTTTWAYIHGLSWQGWTALGYLGLGCSAFGTYLWLRALRQLRVSSIAIAWFLQPVCGSLLAVGLLGEPLTPQLLTGGTLILGAVGLLFRLDPAFAAHRVRGGTVPSRWIPMHAAALVERSYAADSYPIAQWLPPPVYALLPRRRARFRWCPQAYHHRPRRQTGHPHRTAA